MQVAHQTDHVTHAVLGGMGNISFGISDDPAFFQILSSALYKDPIKAMIRETICNAWDSHIDSGRTDRPLTITLDKEKLVIRDYGKGIPHDMIGPIYGVYGASTKKNDGRQTGGFGLGCKSPFAYTDHFEVVSFHDGKRTIYNMSKSSAEKLGKPSIVPIASFPTDESGIQVTIPLQGGMNDYRIAGLVHEVCFNGDISAMFNGELVKKLGLSHAEAGFMLVNDMVSDDSNIKTFNDGRIFIRYGNVIYPVEKSVEIDGIWNKVNNMLTKIYECRLVMMAPPDSISITPSRESLTMSEITVDTLKTLLGNFLVHLLKNQTTTARTHEMVEEFIEKAAKSTNTVQGKLALNSWEIPGIPSSHHNKYLHTTEDFALLDVLLKFTGRKGELPTKKWLNMIQQYLGHMIDAKLIDRGAVQSWRAYAMKCVKDMHSPNRHGYARSRWVGNTKPGGISEGRAATKWLHKHTITPLIQKVLAASPLAKVSMLGLRSDNLREQRCHRGALIPTPVTHVKVTNHTINLRQFVKPTLILCHNAQIVTRRMGKVSRNDRTGTLVYDEYFVMEIPRLKEYVDNLLPAMLTLEGVEVIDITGRLPTEEEEYLERKEQAAKKRAVGQVDAQGKLIPVVPRKQKQGLIRLDQMIRGSKDGINTARIGDPDNNLERMKDPAFIAKVSAAAEQTGRVERFSDTASLAIAKLWGDLGVVTNNSGVYDRNKEKGVLDLNAYVVDKVIKELSVNAEIKEHMKFDAEKVNSLIHQKSGYHASQHLTQIYKILLTTPGLGSIIPGYTELSEENQLRLIVWKEIVRGYNWSDEPGVKDAAKDIESVKLCKEAVEFAQKLIANPYMELIQPDNLKKQLVEGRNDPAVVTKLTTLLQLIIN